MDGVFAETQLFKTAGDYVYVAGNGRDVIVLNRATGAEVGRHQATSVTLWMDRGEDQVVLTEQSITGDERVTVEAISKDGVVWSDEIQARNWPSIVNGRLVIYSENTLTVMQ